MASVLGWRNQPFLTLYRCLQPLVTLAGCGCYRPTPKRVACFGQISVGWREPGLTCHFLVKLHLQSWKTVVTRMLITPKSGYISGCFDSFPHITSVLKEASLLLVKYWLDFSAHIRGPAWFCPAPPRTPNQAPPHPIPHSPTGLSILHEFQLPRPSIFSPVVCTISDNSLYISYTQAAPLTKTWSHPLQPSAMLPAVLCCFNVSVCITLSEYNA